MNILDKIFHKKRKPEDIKLCMVILCKDEADIIRKNIMFHHAMGVDGFIVTDNSSTDGTRKILQELKDRGIIWEIIDEPNMNYAQSEWTNRMIKIAKHKYHADWIIPCDADEFWYAQSLNLKTDIWKNRKSNVLECIMRDYIPLQDRPDFINGTYFIGRFLNKFEMEKYDIKSGEYAGRTPKVMFNIHGYRMISKGNHSVRMRHKRAATIENIRLYHFNIRSFAHFEHKVVKGGETLRNNPDKNVGIHWRNWYENYYLNGKLREAYNAMFNFDKQKTLIEIGAIVNDTSVRDFMEKYCGEIDA